VSAAFPVLTAAITRQLGADNVMVAPPYVFVVKGDRATRYWLPETLKGDSQVIGPFTLRAPPRNAPPLVDDHE
jgi:hypothetical protein